MGGARKRGHSGQAFVLAAGVVIAGVASVAGSVHVAVTAHQGRFVFCRSAYAV